MPIREYKCNECGFQFESIDLGSESSITAEETLCPNCGSADVGKKFSLFSSLRCESTSGTKSTPRQCG